MDERRADNLMAGILLAFALAYFLLSFGYSPLARSLPQLVSGVTVAVLTTYLVTANWGHLKLRSAGTAMVASRLAAIREHRPGDGAAAGDVGKRPTGPLLVGLVLPLAYLAMFAVLGVLPAVFFFIAGYTWRYGKAKWHRAVLAGLVVDLVVYGLFLGILKYPLYTGWIGRLL